MATPPSIPVNVLAGCLHELIEGKCAFRRSPFFLVLNIVLTSCLRLLQEDTGADKGNWRDTDIIDRKIGLL
jgi:hypothetical protein